jgi:hydroxyacylglutathione hydrolase
MNPQTLTGGDPPTLTIETFVDASFGENAYVLSTPDVPPGERASRPPSGAQASPPSSDSQPSSPPSGTQPPPSPFTPLPKGGLGGGLEDHSPRPPASEPPSNPLVGWIIDPSFPPQVNHLLGYVADRNIRIERVILTHGHLDHIAGVDAVLQAHPLAHIAIAHAEHGALASADENLSEHVGMPMTLQSRPDEDLPPGAELSLGALTWRVLDVSGHSPAGRAVYCSQAGIVLTGDALFSGSIGRTDFPGADHHRLLNNIRRNLYTLPPETVVYSGHGPATTIGNERKSNPFVSDSR